MSERNSPSLRVVPYTSISDINKARERRFGVFGVLVVIVVVLFIGSIAANLQGDSPKTFLSFLRMLQNAPHISTDWLSFDSVTVALPDWLDWLDPFIRFVEGVIRVGGFFVTGLVQAITFILHFLTWVFV